MEKQQAALRKNGFLLGRFWMYNGPHVSLYYHRHSKSYQGVTRYGFETLPVKVYDLSPREVKQWLKDCTSCSEEIINFLMTH